VRGKIRTVYVESKSAMKAPFKSTIYSGRLLAAAVPSAPLSLSLRSKLPANRKRPRSVADDQSSSLLYPCAFFLFFCFLFFFKIGA